MALHHKVPRSRGGSDEEWNLIELNDYEHAYEHAIDFVLFEISPFFDCRQPGWKLLPEDLRATVRAEMSRRRLGNAFALGHKGLKGELNGNFGKAPCLGRKRTPEERARISTGNKGKPKSAEHRRKLSEARKGKGTGPRNEQVRANMSEGAKKGWETRKRNQDLTSHS